MPKKKIKLTKADSARLRVLYIMTIIGVVLQKLDEEIGSQEVQNPAVQQVAGVISDIMEELDQERRTAYREAVHRERRILGKKSEDIDTDDGLVACFRVFTGSGLFPTKPGTRLDFVKRTFTENLESIERSFETNEEDAKTFEKYLKGSLYRF